MARQVGPIFLEGTVDDLTFYHSGGKWLVKRKSSLNRKKLLRRPCFVHTRRNADWFGSANQLASTVYSCIDLIYRSRDFYNFLAARAQQLIREGLEGSAVLARLVRYLRIVGIALNEERLAFFVSPEEQATMMREKASRPSHAVHIHPPVVGAILGLEPKSVLVVGRSREKWGAEGAGWRATLSFGSVAGRMRSFVCMRSVC